MPASLAQKLQIKAGQRLVVQNGPAALRTSLASGLHGVTVTTRATGTADAVLVFVNDLAEARTLGPRASRVVGDDGLVWIAYPKGTSGVETDVNRDRLMGALAGWKPVRLVALDDTWSAMRFCPAAKMSKKRLVNPMHTSLSLLLIVLVGSSTLLAQGTGTEEPWKPLRFLVGKWTGIGSGKPGEGSGYFTFSYDLQGTILVRRSHSEYPPKPGESTGIIHDDLLIIYKKTGTLDFRAAYIDNESHVIQYGVTCPRGDSTEIFEADASAAGPRYKLLYDLKPDGILSVEFLVAPPGGSYVSYVKGTARRGE